MQSLRYSRYFKSVMLVTDILVIVAIFSLFFWIRTRATAIYEVATEQNFFSVLMLVLFWILLSGRTHVYHVPRNLTYTNYTERLLTQLIIFLFGILLLAKVSKNELLEAERFRLGGSVFAVFLIIKTAVFFLLKYLRAAGINYRNVMFLGNDPELQILRKTLAQRKDYGFRIHNFPNVEADAETLENFWQEKAIHTMYIPVSGTDREPASFNKIVALAELRKVKIALVPQLLRNEYFEYDLAYVESQPILVPSKFPLDHYSNYVLKRTVDLILSLSVLIFIGSWLFPIICLLILSETKGSPFFIQKRYGYRNQIFGCIKFRTMVINDESSTKITEENDCRITKVGKFLRRTDLDELPQFINVLLGEMSVVGPRPHMLTVDDFYKPKIRKYGIRSAVRPGITGLAQVSGYRGDFGDRETGMQKRIMADYFYVKNWSASMDFVIMLKTALIMLRGGKVRISLK